MKRHRPGWLSVLWSSAVVMLAACGAADTDEDGCTTDPPTWETFGEPFVRSACQGCHARGASERHGAPAEVVFDTEADVARFRAAILSTATGDAARMPPGGGVSDEQRRDLELWLAPETCD